mmetsp:Transcript_86044/g.243061  ORF Transcript_86044/g.243061 Transcript_86044/m.243061 type:complete len:245 (-) Transcript_86044:1085-1819(-)
MNKVVLFHFLTWLLNPTPPTPTATCLALLLFVALPVALRGDQMDSTANDTVIVPPLPSPWSSSVTSCMWGFSLSMDSSSSPSPIFSSPDVVLTWRTSTFSKSPHELTGSISKVSFHRGAVVPILTRDLTLTRDLDPASFDRCRRRNTTYGFRLAKPSPRIKVSLSFAPPLNMAAISSLTVMASPFTSEATLLPSGFVTVSARFFTWLNPSLRPVLPRLPTAKPPATVVSTAAEAKFITSAVLLS